MLRAASLKYKKNKGIFYQIWSGSWKSHKPKNERTTIISWSRSHLATKIRAGKLSSVLNRERPKINPIGVFAVENREKWSISKNDCHSTRLRNDWVFHLKVSKNFATNFYCLIKFRDCIAAFESRSIVFIQVLLNFVPTNTLPWIDSNPVPLKW